MMSMAVTVIRSPASGAPPTVCVPRRRSLRSTRAVPKDGENAGSRSGQNHIFPQLHPRKPPHRFNVLNRLLRSLVRQIEPLLQEVHAQHLLRFQRLGHCPAW